MIRKVAFAAVPLFAIAAGLVALPSSSGSTVQAKGVSSTAHREARGGYGRGYGYGRHPHCRYHHCRYHHCRYHHCRYHRYCCHHYRHHHYRFGW
jgi:hypothetical protein